MSAERLAAQLQAMIADLDGHIQRRAKAIAAPFIELTQAAADARIAEMAQTHADEIQRRDDLLAEVRRQLKALDGQNARLRRAISDRASSKDVTA